MIDQTERRAKLHAGENLSEKLRAVDLGPTPGFIGEIDIVVNRAHQHEVELTRHELERVVLGRQALHVGQRRGSAKRWEISSPAPVRYGVLLCATTRPVGPTTAASNSV